MSTPGQDTSDRHPKHVGPPLAAPALAFVVLFVTSLFLGPRLGSGSTPSPYSSAEVIQSYFANSQLASQVNGFLQLDAAIALAVFTAVMLSRMRYFAPHVPGPVIAAVGGVLASAFLGINGLLQWVLGQSGTTDNPAVVRAFQYLFFSLGGPAHTSAFGLLIAGIAVTSLFLRALPRWLSITGIVIACAAVLSLLSMLITPMSILLPLSRFTGMLWIVIVSFLLPRTRPARRGSTAPSAVSTT